MRDDWIQPVAAWFVVGIAVSASWGWEAVTDADELATLQDYLRYAALHNPGLQAAFEEWKAATEQVPQAKALPDPTVAYSYFTEQVQMRQQVGLMQMFPWFGKIEARTDAAAAAAQAARKRFDARRLQLFFDVKEAFYEYLYLAGAMRIAEENLELGRRFEEVARAKYIAAAAGHPDVLRAQIKVAELQNDLVSLEQMREPTMARLNAVLNRPAQTPLPWPRPEEVRTAELDQPTLVALLKANNPDLQAMGFDVERLRREVDLARKDFYPDIGLGVEWMDMVMGDEDEVRVAVSLTVPLWRRSYKAGELQARAMARRAAHEKKNVENDLISRLSRVWYEFEDNGRQASLYGGVLVPKAQELIGASEAAYMAGNVDFLSLLDAQQTLLRFRLQYERALTDRNRKLAELESLVGSQLTDGGSGAR